MRAKLSLPQLFLVLFALPLMALPALAQERSVGVTVHTEDVYDGYTLFSPVFDRDVFLIDNDGRVIHRWYIKETGGVSEAHLLDNGHVIVVAGVRRDADTSLVPRFYPRNGSIREYTWDGELVWQVDFVGDETRQHHSIDIMPNGNILAILRDHHSLDDALAMGLDPWLVDIELKNHPYLLPDRIVEIDRSTGEFVWEWDSWDHLVQDRDPDLPNYDAAEHPQRIDINYHFWASKDPDDLNQLNGGNWMGSKAVSYNPELDQAVLSVWRFDEFWIIDHSAADSAGGLLYRWGNPAAYQRDKQRADRQLSRPDDVKWIEAGLPGAGNILLFSKFDHVTDKPRSLALELKLPRRSDGSYDWEQEPEVVWSYAVDGARAFNGSAQRLPNGNTLILNADYGRLIEVNAAGEIVWKFVNPISGANLIVLNEGQNALFRARKYSADYPAFAGRDMKPSGRLVDYLQA